MIVFWVKFLSDTCNISKQHSPPCCLAVCTIPCYFPQPVWILPWLPGLEHCSLSRLKWLESMTQKLIAVVPCLFIMQCMAVCGVGQPVDHHIDWRNVCRVANNLFCSHALLCYTLTHSRLVFGLDWDLGNNIQLKLLLASLFYCSH